MGYSSLYECQVQVGAMDGCVAQGTGLIFLGLVVGRPQWAERRRAVTLQTQQVDLGYTQQARIGRAVRRVAAHAAFGLHRRVLVNEGALLLGMALVAEGIASRSGAHLAQRRRSVYVVAVAAGDEPLIYSMVVGAGKLGARRGMAAVAEFGLSLHQQLALDFGVMRAVAIDAADFVAGVRRGAKMLLLMGLAVALKTAPAGLCPRQVREADDLQFCLRPPPRARRPDHGRIHNRGHPS